MGRRLIHQLNKRYREQWLRAELLQRETRRLRRSWLLDAARSCLRFFFPWREPAPVEGAPRFLEGQAAPSGSVAIVIPFRDQPGLLRGCLRSLRRSAYPGRQTVLVDNGSSEPRLLRWLARRPERVVRDAGPFNFSRLCNAGAAAAPSAEWLLFLNNDTEALHADWLERLLAVGGLPGVGVVGAHLFFPDGTVQHAGMCQDASGRWVHPHQRLTAREAARHPVLSRPREAEAVTGACLLVRASLFRQLGGFDESRPQEGGDVDLCRRAWEAGWKVAIAPAARLMHYEGLSRGRNPGMAPCSLAGG